MPVPPVAPLVLPVPPIPLVPLPLMPVLPLPAAPLVPPVALLLELSPVVSGPDEAPLDEGLPGAPEALEVAELLRFASARSSSRPHAAADKASATLKAINEGFIMGSFLWSLSKADRNTQIDTHGASQEPCRTRRMVSGRSGRRQAQ
jgi:hypothetical protein